MPYDANLVLRGVDADGAYSDLVTGDTSAVSLVVNSDGNRVIDLGPHGTGAKGIDIVVIFHDTFDDYQATLVVQVCDSDHVAGGWELNLEFPTLYPYTREIIARATTGFVAAAANTDFGVALVDTGTGGMAGLIRAFSRKLLTVGGVGKIWVAMQDAGDTYPTDEDTLTSAGTGVATQIGASRLIQQNGFTMVRRMSTPRRYIRCTCVATNGSAAINCGDVDILATGSQHNHVNNLYR